MELYEFNNHFLPNLLEKLSYENKTIVLLGDFNANLLNYDTNTDVSNFLDQIYCSSFLPVITSPTKITAKSQTLIDNIFANALDTTLWSENIATTLSDHNAQFLLLKGQSKTSKNTQNQHYRDFRFVEEQENANTN